MKNIWVVGILAALAASAIGASCAWAAEKAGTEKGHLAPLERFIGHWVIDAKWSNGQALHARNVYEWGLGKQIIKTRTFVKNDDSEYQRYEGILAWNPKKQCLFHVSFAFNGDMTEALIESKDRDTLNIGWNPYREGEAGQVRQTIKFKDQDSFVWTVWVKNGTEWQQIMEGTWKRKDK